MKSSLLRCLVLGCLFIPAPAGAVAGGSGSGVGDGGDLVSSFLEKTRYALLRTADYLAQPAAPELADPCQEDRPLTSPQREECGKLVLTVRDVLRSLPAEGRHPEFLVRSEALEVVGPDGQSRPVSARTRLGPEGPIEFHLASIQFLSPEQLLSLMAHEFGHKSAFEGRYVEDNLPTRAFASGRELLDAMARAYSRIALARGLIGRSYGVGDRFDCQVQTRADLPPNRTLGVTPRSFVSSDSFERFESRIGWQPQDLFVEAGETWTTRISLRAIFHEENACRPGETQGRWTRLELVRSRTESNLAGFGSMAGMADEVLAVEERPGWNPLCEEKKTPFALRYGDFEFRCRHLGVVAEHVY